MSRYSQQGSPRRFAFPACLVVACVLAVLPSRVTGWLTGVSSVAWFAIAPVQQPVYRLARWLSPGRGTRVEDPLLGKEREEKERYQAMYLRERERTAELERRIAELQSGVLASDVPVRQVSATVVGLASEPGGEVIIRAGAGQGVEPNNVVTAGGVQIVGRVTSAGSRMSQVRLLTAPSTGKLLGVVMNADGSLGPGCMLNPSSSGDVLLGYVEGQSDGGKVSVGQMVRLRDDQWPRSSSMLVIGEIVSAEDSLGQHQKIKVRPTRDLERLSEVVVRTNPEPGDGDAPPRKSVDAKPAAGGSR